MKISHFPNTAELVNALKSSDGYHAWHAAETAGNQKTREAIPLLFEIISRPNPDLGDADLRRISVWALAQFSYAELEVAAAKTAVSQNPLAREGVADLLGFYSSSEPAFALLKVLAKDENYDVRLWAALSLAKHGEKALSFLKQLQSSAGDKRDRDLWDDALAKIANKRS